MSVVDEYLQTVGERERQVLEHICAIAREELQGAEEVISYNLPAFKFGGKVIIGFYVNKHFMSLYPFSGGVLGGMSDDIKDFSQTKSALQFTPEHQVPDETIRKMIQLRREEAGV